MNDIDDHTTKNDVLTLIREYLSADDCEPNDAERIYEYFYNKGINWLIAEMVLNIVDENKDALNELAADLYEEKELKNEN